MLNQSLLNNSMQSFIVWKALMNLLMMIFAWESSLYHDEHVAATTIVGTISMFTTLTYFLVIQ